jgi:hypothetical protein
MAMLVYLQKEDETPAAVRYRFHTDGGTVRYHVLDKQAETILPDDGNKDGVFRAVAGKLAKAWLGTGEAPDQLTYQA